VELPQDAQGVLQVLEDVLETDAIQGGRGTACQVPGGEDLDPLSRQLLSPLAVGRDVVPGQVGVPETGKAKSQDPLPYP